MIKSLNAYLKTFCITLIAIVLLTLGSCALDHGQIDDGKLNTYEIVFVFNDAEGNLVTEKAVEIVKGEKIRISQIPLIKETLKRAGYEVPESYEVYWVLLDEEKQPINLDPNADVNNLLNITNDLCDKEGKVYVQSAYRKLGASVTFFSNGGTPVKSIVDLKEGDSLAGHKPADPTKVGYTFVGWFNKELTEEFNWNTLLPRDGIDLYAKWEANDATGYVVEHYLEQLDGAYKLEEAQELFAATDELVSAEALEYVGFSHNAKHAEAEEQGKVLADGSLLLKVFYSRNEYTVTFDAAGGVAKAEQTYKYGETLELGATTKTGYTFLGWLLEGKELELSTMPAQNLELVADWMEGVGVQYKVEHYFEALDGSYVKDAKVETKVGKTGALVSAKVREVAGFEQNEDHKDALEQALILADGSLVLKVFYSRIEYTVSFDANGGSAKAEQVYKYGQTLALGETTKVGYTFVEWLYEGNQLVYVTMPAQDLELAAKWTPNQDTLYSVEHYFEQLDGSYKLDAKVDELQAATEAKVTAVARVVEGFTHNSEHKDAYEVAYVLADGSLVLEVYYTRNEYTVSFDANGGVAKAEQTYLYGEELDLGVTTRTGYTFAGWAPKAPTTMPAEDLEFVAQWTANTNTAYKVQHYFEQLDGSYKLDATVDSLQGTTDTTVKAVARTVAGFTHNSKHANAFESSNLNPDGSLVLSVYYSRNTYTLTINVDGVKEEVEYLFEEAVEAVASPEKTGYTFAGWSPKVPATMPAEDVEVVAEWTINQYTLTINIDGVKEKVVYDYNEAVEAIEDPEKTGYTFAGWSPKVPATMPAEDVEVVAEWTINQYTLTINIDGVKEEVVYDYNEAVEAIEDPAKKGYTFAGWSPVVPATMPAEDVEVVAEWTLNKYTITFDVEDGRNFAINGAPTKVIDIAYYDNSALKDKIYFCDTGVSKNNSLKWQYKILLKYDATINAYEVVAVDAATSSTSGLGVEWTHAISSASVKTLSTYASVGQYIVLSEDVKLGDTNFTASVYNYSQFNNAKQPVEYDVHTAVSLAELTRTGYTFLGWFDEEDNKVTSIAQGTIGDMTISAKWKINQYTISFDSNGGSAVQSITQDYLSEIVAPANPTKAGFEFIGWTPVLPDNMPAENVELVAQWGPITYNISYDLDGANPLPFYNSYEEAVADFLKDYNAARGKSHTVETFSSLGSMTEIGAASLFLYNATYKAKWSWLVNYIATIAGSANKVAYQTFYNYNSQAELDAANSNNIYCIAYELRGWVGQIKYTKNAGFATADYSQESIKSGCEALLIPTQYNVDSDTITLPTPVKAYHTFLGWFDQADNKVTEISKGSTGNIALTAKWQVNSYTFKYTIDGVEKEVEYNYGATIEKPANPTKVGYTFNGWSVAIPDTMPGHNIETEAQFTINSHDFTYIVDGVETTKSYNYGETIEYPANPTKVGYTFEGWVGDKPATMPDSDVTITADFEVITYTITYNLAGGTNHANNPATYTVEDEITLLAPTKTDYDFLGWFDGEDQLVSVLNHATGNLVLTAKWDQNAYAISYDLNGGSWKEEEGATKYSSLLGYELPLLVKEGYTFNGWYENDEFTGEAVTEIVLGSTGAKAFYAKWTINTYTVTFDSNEGSAVADQNINYGSKVEKPADPTRNGYAFVKWQSNGEDYDFEATVTGDLELVAVWEMATYTISYNVDGGTLQAEYADLAALKADFDKDYKALTGLSSYSVWNGTSARLLKLFTDSNHKWDWILDYWSVVNTNSYNSVTNASAFQQVKTQGTVPAGSEYYFLAVEITCWYEAKLSSVYSGALKSADYASDAVNQLIWNYAPSKSSYRMDSADYYLVIPTKADHIFLGWYDNSEFNGEPLTKIATGSYGNKTLYAKWVHVLDNAKNNALAALDEYMTSDEIVNGSHYAINAAELAAEYQAQKALINAAGTVDAVDEVLENAKKALLAIANPIAPTSISVDAISKTPMVGASLALQLSFEGPEGYQKLADYVSSNNEIATVENGVVKFLALGNVTITVSSSIDPSVKGTIEFEVIPVSINNVMVDASAVDSTCIKQEEEYFYYGINLFKTIDEAISIASSDVSIYINAGTYALNSIINKSLTFKGANRETVIVNVKVGTSNVAASYVEFKSVTLTGKSGQPFGFTSAAKTLIFDNCIIKNTKTFIKCDKAVDITIKNSHISAIDQFLVWGVESNFKSLTLTGNTIDASNCGATANTGGALIRIRSGYAYIYDNVFIGNIPTATPGYFECNVATELMDIRFNIFKNVTKFVFIHSTNAAMPIQFDENLYLDAEDNVLAEVPAEVTGTNVTAGNALESEAARAAAYAYFLAPSKSLTLNLNEGTLLNAPTSYKVGYGLVLPVPTRDGYTFLGWYDNAGLTGSPIESISTTADIEMVLYASWQSNAQTVYSNLSFELNGGLVAEELPTQYLEGTVTVLPVPTKTGYAFEGWFDNAEFIGSAVEEISNLETGDLAFYAKWTVVEYSINYSLNGGQLNKYPTQYLSKAEMVADFIKDYNTVYGTAHTKPEELHSARTTTLWQNEAMFNKWVWMLEYLRDLAHIQFGADGYVYYDNVYNNGEFGGAVSGYFTQSISIYLLGINATQWNETYSATYGGLNSKWTTLDFTSENVNKYQDYMIFAPEEFTIEDSIVLTTPEKAGYQFMGWYNNDEFTGEKVTTIPAGTTGDIELHAYFVKVLELTDADETVFASVTPTKFVNANFTEEDYLIQEEKYSYGTQLFKSIAAALAVAQENDVIYVFAGTYADALTISVANVSLIGPNYNVKGSASRAAEANVTGLTDLTGSSVTVNGLKFTESANVKVSNSNITIKSSYIAPSSNIGSAGSNRKGVLVSGVTTTLANVQILDNYLDTPGTTFAITSENIVFDNVSNCVISGNYITNSDVTAAAGSSSYPGSQAMIRLYGVSGTLNISNNEFYWGTYGYAFEIANNSNSCTEINIIENIFDKIMIDT